MEGNIDGDLVVERDNEEDKGERRALAGEERERERRRVSREAERCTLAGGPVPVAIAEVRLIRGL